MVFVSSSSYQKSHERYINININIYIYIHTHTHISLLPITTFKSFVIFPLSISGIVSSDHLGVPLCSPIFSLILQSPIILTLLILFPSLPDPWTSHLYPPQSPTGMITTVSLLSSIIALSSVSQFQWVCIQTTTYQLLLCRSRISTSPVLPVHFPKGPHHLSSLSCFTVIMNTSLQTPSTLSSLKNTQLIFRSECFSLQVSGTQLYSFEYKRHSVSHNLEIQKSRTAGSRGSRMMNNFSLSLLCLPL